MPINIRMYNCAFGDCFRISHRDELQELEHHLYVDFGIHAKCMNKVLRQNRYDEIIDDIPTQNVDFLLTHYHYDHYEGALYMGERQRRKFHDVYIPDVWNEHTNISVIELLLLSDAYRNTVLAYGKSLISFLISICHATGRIYFVQRGTEIQENYIALWPRVDAINEAANRLLDNFQNQENIQLPAGIHDIAQDLKETVQNMHNAASEDERIQFVPLLEALERRLKELAQNIEIEKSAQRKLAEFRHSINIIFHNHVRSGRNILFAGDAEGDSTRKGADMWEYIQGNRDGRVPMHVQYEVIKIPHHGTVPHYHDFTRLSDRNTVYLIPNGRRYNWRIDRKYAKNANAYHCTVCCSNNDSCEAAQPICNCRRRHIVNTFHEGYFDI